MSAQHNTNAGSTVLDNIALENLRTGYQAAVQLITYEGQLAWTAVAAFAPMLALLLAGAVLEEPPLISDPLYIKIFHTLSALVGLVASLVWLSASARSRRIHKYWLASARDFETNIDRVKTLTTGKKITDRVLEIAGGEKTTDRSGVFAGGGWHKLRWYESLSHTACFFLLYSYCAILFGVILFSHLFLL